MGTVRRLSPARADVVETQLRARSEELTRHRMPLGVCRMCGTIVYSGDALALVGGSLLHGRCGSTEEDRS